jgi:glycosyltransferase involved in cell wall biosynthesis
VAAQACDCDLRYRDRVIMQEVDSTVFAVIPVYNRKELTVRCICQLLAQSYRRLRIIVADGGSTDGTADVLRRDFPQVTLLLPASNELWWAGAMAMGIAYVLQTSGASDDFLLMMNNDTEIPPEYVATLVRVSREHRAAVGALTVDFRDPRRIIDAGEFIDWQNYAFPVRTSIEPGEVFFDGVDVLPGRGSLVPLEMVRQAGNVDYRRFPHYIADYEFFSRLKRAGFRLGVTYELSLKSDQTTTGIAARAGEKRTIARSLVLMFSRRSMDNVIDHFRFICAAAPPTLRNRALRVFFFRIVWRALNRFHLGAIARLLTSTTSRCVLLVRGTYRLPIRLIIPVYYVTDFQCEDYGVDVEALVRDGIVRREGTSERYVFSMRANKVRAHSRSTAALYEEARSRRQVVGLGEEFPLLGRIISRLRHGVYRLCRLVIPVYYVTDFQCEDYGVDVEALVRDGIVRREGTSERYVFSMRANKVRAHSRSTAALYEEARSRRQALGTYASIFLDSWAKR